MLSMYSIVPDMNAERPMFAVEALDKFHNSVITTGEKCCYAFTLVQSIMTSIAYHHVRPDLERTDLQTRKEKKRNLQSH